MSAADANQIHSSASNDVITNLLRMSQSLAQNYSDFVAKQLAASSQSSVTQLTTNFMPEASKFAALQEVYAERHSRLWQSFAHQTEEPVVPEALSDRRFSNPAWAASPYYNYLRQAYVLNANFLNELAQSLPIADQHTKTRVQFLTRQYVDAMSPANFAATNPEFVDKALRTEGQSITAGIMNLIGDMEKGRISMTDESAFEVGKNLAVTSGEVVFENEVMQLIQYTPLTPKIAQTPLLIVPPCINKYYILDLQPENSFVKHAVENGINVFLVSWRNPSAEQGNLGWDDYLDAGVLQALKVVRSISKVDQPNTLGFCIGGTLLASALAVAYARGENPVASMTLLTTLLDYTEPGELGCFVDKAAVATREAAIGKGGLMSGQELANVFSSLRPNDLIWNYVVENYLKGGRPTAFDLLYWNSDCTNLPGPFAAYYLRNMYLENNLRIPGKLQMLGQAVDLGLVSAPTYIFATREDHIVPWQSSYLGRRLLGGQNQFVLGASGHIAGVINPVSKNRRSYWVNDATVTTADQWFAGAVEHKGSWWGHWLQWLKGMSGKEIAAPKALGNATYPVLEPAPGRYVKQRA